VGRTMRILGRDVARGEGVPIRVDFSDGAQGKTDAGIYEFWTISDGKKIDTVRCREHADPAERFERMKGDPDYEQSWEIASNATFISPSTQRRVEKWLDGHPYDALFAGTCWNGDKATKIVKTAHGYQIH
jgi:hypothetical protein